MKSVALCSFLSVIFLNLFLCLASFLNISWIFMTLINFFI